MFEVFERGWDCFKMLLVSTGFLFLFVKAEAGKKKTKRDFKNTHKPVKKATVWPICRAGQLLISNLGAAKEFILCI